MLRRSALVNAISETLGRLEVPEQKLLEIALAVQEALANAVVHGCGNDPSKQVRCRLKTDADRHILISGSTNVPPSAEWAWINHYHHKRDQDYFEKAVRKSVLVGIRFETRSSERH